MSAIDSVKDDYDDEADEYSFDSGEEKPPESDDSFFQKNPVTDRRSSANPYNQRPKIEPPKKQPTKQGSSV